MSMKAVWNNTIIEESEESIVREGNHCFPPEAISRRYLEASAHRTGCPWKGTASRCNGVANGGENKSLPRPCFALKSGAKMIKGNTAFWRGIRIEG
jgi:uncharacterized protein (DUF427 family)